jgi:hypothetical protein
MEIAASNPVFPALRALYSRFRKAYLSLTCVCLCFEIKDLPMPKGSAQSRRFRTLLSICALGILAGTGTAGAGESKSRTKANPNPPVPASLDQRKIHTIYSEGDFEGVITAIDSFTAVQKNYGHDDSVFIAKHLAVIYTANPATREKGKNYMFRLLNLVPSAKIVDMFVSDEIDHIFEKVREEYVVRQQSMGQERPSQAESNQYAANKLTVQPKSGQPRPEHADQDPKPGKRSSRAVYWMAGGVTLIAVTGAAYYFLQPAKTTDKTYDVP